jgi:hypothetical protein
MAELQAQIAIPGTQGRLVIVEAIPLFSFVKVLKWENMKGKMHFIRFLRENRI